MYDAIKATSTHELKCKDTLIRYIKTYKCPLVLTHREYKKDDIDLRHHPAVYFWHRTNKWRWDRKFLETMSNSDLVKLCEYLEETYSPRSLYIDYEDYEFN